MPLSGGKVAVRYDGQPEETEGDRVSGENLPASDHAAAVDVAASFGTGITVHAQTLSVVQNASGMRLAVAGENTDPTLHIILPGHPDSDRAIEVIFPEHVTARKSGETEARHLFLFNPANKETDLLGGRLASLCSTKRISRADCTCLRAPRLKTMGCAFTTNS